ncbi:MAG: DUF5916 domain-containing protein [Gemmatimonadaceae bacterium]
MPTDRVAPMTAVRRYARTPKGLFTLALALLTGIAASYEGWRLVLPPLLGAMVAAMAIDAPLLRWRSGRWSYPDGALLTGWLVALILSPHEPWYIASATAVVGVVSKYLVRARRANVFNPAALGLVATFYLFDTGQSWWGALPEVPLPWLLVLLASGAWLAVRLNKVPAVLAFLGVYFLLGTLRAFVSNPAHVAELFRAPDVHAALFFALFMVTDPPTSPPRHVDQMIFGTITAVAGFAAFQWIGAAYFLLAGVLVANAWEGWRKQQLGRRQALRAALLFLALAAGPHTLSAQAAPAADRHVRAVRTTTPIVVDGHLTEAAWATATPANGFTQTEPRTGAPATEATEVRVLFDADALYIGAVLHDPDAARIVLNDIRKDFKEEDQDDFEVLLDTFHDRRNGYVFLTNSAGARADRQVANEGREINTSWDGVWTVKTQKTTDGWTLEMAIPFKSLRYQLGDTEGWGINFARRIRHRNEVTYWAPIPRSFTITRASLAGTLDGLTIDGASRDLRIKPYAMGRTVRDLGGAHGITSEAAGLDVTYGVTRHLGLNVTLNPDFAQVEADEQQVNLTQFSQFFPEKREFFLENSGIFYVGDAARNNRVQLAPTPDEDMLLFFSRRIGLSPDGRAVPIPAGVRLTGTAGGLTIGALSMQTQRTGTAPANRYSALRLRRNLMPGSDIGVIVLDRESVGSGSGASWNRVAGIDANFRLPGVWDWNSYAVGTRTPGKNGGQYTWRTSLNHEDNFVHIKAGVLEVGRGFADDLGYFRRTDTRKYLIDFGLRPRPSWLSVIGTRELHPHITWNYYENLHGQIMAKDLHSGFTFFQSSGAYWELSVNPRFQRILTPFRINSAIASIPAGAYPWTEVMFKGATNLSRPLAATYTFTEGGLWNGRQHTQQLLITARPRAQFSTSVGVSHTAATLTLPNAAFEALLWTARANYSFTTNMFFDGLAQYDPRSHLLNANLRFNLIHHPLSDLFVVFNQQKINLPDAPATGFGVIVKYTQMFAF